MDFDNKRLKLRREWLPDAEQLIERSEKIDPKMELMAPPPIINGKPFIWSEMDHLDVVAAYEGKQIADRKAGKKIYHDAIRDEVDEVADHKDWDEPPKMTSKEVDTRKSNNEFAKLLEEINKAKGIR